MSSFCHRCINNCAITIWRNCCQCLRALAFFFLFVLHVLFQILTKLLFNECTLPVEYAVAPLQTLKKAVASAANIIQSALALNGFNVVSCAPRFRFLSARKCVPPSASSACIWRSRPPVLLNPYAMNPWGPSCPFRHFCSKVSSWAPSTYEALTPLTFELSSSTALSHRSPLHLFGFGSVKHNHSDG